MKAAQRHQVADPQLRHLLPKSGRERLGQKDRPVESRRLRITVLPGNGGGEALLQRIGILPDCLDPGRNVGAFEVVDKTDPFRGEKLQSDPLPLQRRFSIAAGIEEQPLVAADLQNPILTPGRGFRDRFDHVAPGVEKGFRDELPVTAILPGQMQRKKQQHNPPEEPPFPTPLQQRNLFDRPGHPFFLSVLPTIHQIGGSSMFPSRISILPSSKTTSKPLLPLSASTKRVNRF